jgi:hypothetical protein
VGDFAGLNDLPGNSFVGPGGFVEQVATLQAALSESMFDDWLDRASFPEALISTWRGHRLDVFAHL